MHQKIMKSMHMHVLQAGMLMTDNNLITIEHEEEDDEAEGEKLHHGRTGVVEGTKREIDDGWETRGFGCCIYRASSSVG